MTGMTSELLGPLALFAFAASVTPGPNNTMLLASGANFGLLASAPHMAGVLAGFLLLLLVVGSGLGGLFVAYPLLHVALAWAGTLYLLYLAARIALSRGMAARKDGARPLRFVQAAVFQAVNPKGWAMALGAMTAYAPQAHYLLNVLIVVLVFAPINGACIILWTAFGVSMRRFLDRPAVLKGFNLVMAAALALSLIPSLHELMTAPKGNAAVNSSSAGPAPVRR